MTHRPTRIIFPALLFALALGALPGTAGAAPSFVDTQVKANVLLLRGYIDSYAVKNEFAYPPATMVKKGGGLVAPVWPGNPWSGKTMAPGKSRGTYTYRLTTTGYALIGHLSKGSYKVTGGLPTWLRDERNAASKTGLALIQEYVQAYAASHSGAFPQASDVAAAGFLTLQPGAIIWPQDPWAHANMTQGTGTGQFTYVPSAGGYALSVHLAGGTSWAPPGH